MSLGISRNFQVLSWFFNYSAKLEGLWWFRGRTIPKTLKHGFKEAPGKLTVGGQEPDSAVRPTLILLSSARGMEV